MLVRTKYPKTVNRYIAICFQSNVQLNNELDMDAKQEIARLLIENVTYIRGISSRLHGQILLRVPNRNVVKKLKEIVELLNAPLSERTPPLLFSVFLISHQIKDGLCDNWFYSYGDDDMNENFLESINDVWPKK